MFVKHFLIDPFSGTSNVDNVNAWIKAQFTKISEALGLTVFDDLEGYPGSPALSGIHAFYAGYEDSEGHKVPILDASANLYNSSLTSTVLFFGSPYYRVLNGVINDLRPSYNMDNRVASYMGDGTYYKPALGFSTSGVEADLFTPFIELYITDSGAAVHADLFDFGNGVKTVYLYHDDAYKSIQSKYYIDMSITLLPTKDSDGATGYVVMFAGAGNWNVRTASDRKFVYAIGPNAYLSCNRGYVSGISTGNYVAPAASVYNTVFGQRTVRTVLGGCVSDDNTGLIHVGYYNNNLPKNRDVAIRIPYFLSENVEDPSYTDALLLATNITNAHVVERKVEIDGHTYYVVAEEGSANGCVLIEDTNL